MGGTTVFHRVRRQVSLRGVFKFEKKQENIPFQTWWLTLKTASGFRDKLLNIRRRSRFSVAVPPSVIVGPISKKRRDRVVMRAWYWYWYWHWHWPGRAAFLLLSHLLPPPGACLPFLGRQVVLLVYAGRQCHALALLSWQQFGRPPPGHPRTQEAASPSAEA